MFRGRGWKPTNFDTKILVNKVPIESPTHEVDCCPLCPQKRTFVSAGWMSEKCQKRTSEGTVHLKGLFPQRGRICDISRLVKIFLRCGYRLPWSHYCAMRGPQPS